MHIAILAPSERSFISHFLPDQDVNDLPIGYFGAPFIGTLITELLNNHHQVTAITTSVAINNDYTVKKFTADNFSWIVVPQRPRSLRMNGKKRGYILDFFSDEQKLMVDCIRDVSPDFVHAHWSYDFRI